MFQVYKLHDKANTNLRREQFRGVCFKTFIYSSYYSKRFCFRTCCLTDILRAAQFKVKKLNVLAGGELEEL